MESPRFPLIKLNNSTSLSPIKVLTRSMSSTSSFSSNNYNNSLQNQKYQFESPKKIKQQNPVLYKIPNDNNIRIQNNIHIKKLNDNNYDSFSNNILIFSHIIFTIHSFKEVKKYIIIITIHQ